MESIDTLALNIVEISNGFIRGNGVKLNIIKHIRMFESIVVFYFSIILSLLEKFAIQMQNYLLSNEERS